MGNVFWFTGMSGTGKSTLAKKIEEHLDNDFTIQYFEGKKIATNLGVFEFRRRKKGKMDDFVKKIATMASNSSKKNNIVLVVISCSKQKFQNIAREILGPKYHEIYIHCSEKSRKKRMGIRKLPKITLIRKFFLKIFYSTSSKNEYKEYHFEPPQFPDITIDTDKQSIDESVKTAVNFIIPKITEVNKK